MRLLTHNTLKNNSSAAKGKGFPLKITATNIRVDDNNHNMDIDVQIGFVRKILPTLDWPALTQVSKTGRIVNVFYLLNLTAMRRLRF
jgi:hypothetical protein